MLFRVYLRLFSLRRLSHCCTDDALGYDIHLTLEVFPAKENKKAAPV